MQDKKPDVPVSEDGNLVIVTTPEYVKEAINEHAQSRNHPNATLQDKGFVVLSNDTGSDSETMAATPKAVKAAYDLANTANNNAGDRVPIGRKVNGHALSADITLNAEDVGTYTKAETDSHISEVNTLATTANQNAINANTNAESRLAKNQNGADIPNKQEFISNIGAVSENGGVYPGSFQFQQIETTPKEANPVKIVSAPHQEANKLVAFTNYGWYCNDIQTGIVRGGSSDTLGYAVDINTRRAFTVDPWGIGVNPNIPRGGINMFRPNGTFWRIEGLPNDEKTLLYFLDRNAAGNKNESVQALPKGFGTIMSTSQHYIDASGFVKNITPVINLFSDGSLKKNGGSEGATAERVSKGIYHIKGVSGFNTRDIWSNIEIPLCLNKLPLVWVNHETLPDGSIKLMTYHREHSDAPIFARNIREGYSDGDLIDIPDGRFISVRVQMPDTK
ncbi:MULTISPECIES: tail fiber protein [Xenorhabdus]|uniref:Tail fiber-like repeat protein n=1 Tax=Xenorhabdus ehlersii TaxID=290111 RepID=A0A2D0IX49_9GAMM|nr:MULTISPECIES: phage tail protein [Xenorhabdus]MBC8950336.1 tail protein [Xenorhabdus sp. TS4]PHM26348.1 tail protein [Xenorhabdus ehlersii]RKE91594.1 tail fiber-like repeat protein [Xenorhabdus ehlersii]